MRPLLRIVLTGAVLSFPVAFAGQPWLRARTEHFVLVGDAQQGVASEVARSLEHFRTMVEQETPLRFATGERIAYAFQGGGSLREATGLGWGARWIEGAFSRSELGGALVAVAGSSDLGVRRIRHELVHELLDPKDPPRWLDEGLAEYLSTWTVSADTIQLGATSSPRPQEESRAGCGWLPSAVLFDLRLYPSSARERCGFYRTSMLLVQHLAESKGGLPGLFALVDTIASGTSSADAVRRHYGLEPAALDESLKAWAAGGRAGKGVRLHVPLPPAARTVAFDRLPHLEHQILLGDLRLSFRDAEGAAQVFRKARRLAPDDPRAATGLAVALAVMGQERKALPLLEQCLATGQAREGLRLAYGLALLFRGFDRGIEGKGLELQEDHRRAREIVESEPSNRHNLALRGIVLGFASLTDPSPEAIGVAREALEQAREAETAPHLVIAGLLVAAARAGDDAELARLSASEGGQSGYVRRLARAVARALRERSGSRPELTEQAARVEALVLPPRKLERKKEKGES